MARLSQGGSLQQYRIQRQAQHVQRRIRIPTTHLAGRLNLQGRWNILNYEYDASTERLQLHRSKPNDISPQDRGGAEVDHAQGAGREVDELIEHDVESFLDLLASDMGDEDDSLDPQAHGLVTSSSPESNTFHQSTNPTTAEEDDVEDEEDEEEALEEIDEEQEPNDGYERWLEGERARIARSLEAYPPDRQREIENRMGERARQEEMNRCPVEFHLTPDEMMGSDGHDQFEEGEDDDE